MGAPLEWTTLSALGVGMPRRVCLLFIGCEILRTIIDAHVLLIWDELNLDSEKSSIFLF